ncbi:MAG: hypothetical protein WBW73_23835 [Rhodoplanes sp.]
MPIVRLDVFDDRQHACDPSLVLGGLRGEVLDWLQVLTGPALPLHVVVEGAPRPCRVVGNPQRARLQLISVALGEATAHHEELAGSRATVCR